MRETERVQQGERKKKRGKDNEQIEKQANGGEGGIGSEDRERQRRR